MKKLAVLQIFVMLVSSFAPNILFFPSIALGQETNQTTTQETTTTEPTVTQTTEPTPVEEIKPQIVCPVSPPPPTCPTGQQIFTDIDPNGCLTGYRCSLVATAEQIAQLPSRNDFDAVQRYCEQKHSGQPRIQCDGAWAFDENNICNFKCVSAQPPPTCPAEFNPVCGTNGVTFPNECYAKLTNVPVAHSGECPPRQISTANIPPGCRQEVEEKTGFLRIVCEARERFCPAEQQQAELKLRCSQQGGNIIPFQDPNGCTFYDCRFDKRGINPNPITGFDNCPNVRETDEQVRACTASGLFPKIAFEGGCKIVKCVQKEERICPDVSEIRRSQIAETCGPRGLQVVQDFAENGCPLLRCGEPDFCQQDVPKEAFNKCQMIGGEMVVRRDDRGCVSFSECVTQGDEKYSFAEPVTDVPDVTELLGIVVKLEKLAVEFDKLSRQTDEIALYYSSVGSDEAARFERVSSMLDSAVQKINEMRQKIRDRIGNLSNDDVVEIKSDLKYLKEVMLKDIVYVMLSSSDDVKQSINAEKKIRTLGRPDRISVEEIQSIEGVKDCGTDGSCFDRAFRVCKPISFRPEGDHGPTMIIVGLDGKNCVVKANLGEGQGPPPGFIRGVNPPYEMTCRFDDYALGVSGPQDFIENCQGSMVELMKQFGGPAAVTGGAQFPPPEGGPGGCKSVQECANYCIDNYDDCVKWTKEHPAYGTPPSREELQRISTGQFGGPGGCQSDAECASFCQRNPEECLRFCENNPNICPPEAQQHLRQALQSGGGFSGGQGEFERRAKEFQQTGGQISQPSGFGGGAGQIEQQACVGCLNNGICDLGECSECVDCLRSRAK